MNTRRPCTILLQAVVQQPVIVGFNANELFPHYAGGLWTSSECSYTYDAFGRPDAMNTPLNHVSLLHLRVVAIAG